MVTRIGVFSLAFVSLAFPQNPRIPLQPRTEDGAYSRWLNKEVKDSRLLDDMESLSHWSFRGVGEMTVTDARSKDGLHSLRMTSLASEATAGGDSEWADMVATRTFPAEDWTGHNRISIWVYADVTGAPSISFSIMLHNDGAHKLPDRYNEGRHESINLNNHSWNHVVWEIAPLDRDKVTAVDFAYSLPKKLPDLGDSTILDLDHLELQTVVPDHTEGWDVASGRIAFSNSGYNAGASKSAIASGLKAAEFSLIRQDSGERVLTKPVKRVKAALGEYQVLDFSEVSDPGTYTIQAGEEITRPFRIGDDAWESSIWKALNFLYSERCGMEIPGIHGKCHQDCYGVHGDKRIIVNGGYHDAGDLTATGNTPGVVYAMLSLAERLKIQGQNPALFDRLIEESKWGLDWVLKTRFGDGFRTTGQLISYWTDNIMGDADDRFGNAVNDPEWNFRVSSVEALAARVLRQSDPDLSARSLRIAKEDWEFAVAGLKTAVPLPEVYGSKDELERTSLGVLASADLFQATGDPRYSAKAFELAELIVASQERKLQPWSIPLTGYFYTTPKKENLFHRFHMGEEQAPIVALARLCELFPDHADWMKWYSVGVLHSEYYLKAAAKINEPYDLLPAAVYRDSESTLIPVGKDWTPLRAADRGAFVAQVHEGVPLGGEYYLRRFPVWFDFRGNYSVLLSQAKALATAGRVRGDLDAVGLAEKQAEWIVGRNPFAASTMYGEGYDWVPLYSVRSGQMVGALPVGMETKGFADAPYWPTQICWTYKEVWTHSVGRWLWLMQDFAGPAAIDGVLDAGTSAPVEIRERTTGQSYPIQPDQVRGAFHAVVPEGRYTISQGSRQTSLTVLPEQRYDVDLRGQHILDFTLTGVPGSDGEVRLRLLANGVGHHNFTIRTDNLTVDKNQQGVDLKPDGSETVEWRCRPISRDVPWIAVVIPDDSFVKRREITGVVSK